MTRTTTRPTFERQLIGLAVAACFAGIVHANPTGPAVASGSASFATSGNTLTVTNTPGAIINWQAFSIRPDEVTRFIQSGAASAVLNRVTGPGQSAILGQLLSNGRVFLINPNGVVVGAGARIDTAGFVASSLNLSNEDFLAGRFRFTDPGSAGKVTNAGSINAHSGGPVYLIAPTVENHGVITAPNGDILLAAGKSVELVSTGSPHLRVQVEAGGEAVNVGQLLADSGRVGLYGAAIRNAGTISADSASVNAAGNVVLKASRDVTLERTSVVSASGGKGGTVEIQAEQGTLLAEGRVAATGAVDKGGGVKLLGTQVGLVGAAAVDASGASGGGTVNIGGSRQGTGPLPNSRAIFIGADARVDASATASGDGGTVIAYADDAARIYGHLSARGGPHGGDGGFIETSGKQYLDVLRTPDATAPAGRGGEWLIDPNNILIVTAAGTCANLSGCAAGPNWATTNDGAQLGVNLINTALNAGQNVTVTTTTSGANTQPGNITFQPNANIAKTAGAADATVTLSAHNDINTTGATISAANNVAVGRLNVVLTADSDSLGAGNVTVGGGVTTRGGSFTATGVSVGGTGAINTSGIAGRTGGNITLTGQTAGTVNVTGAMTASGGAAAAGSAGNAGGTVSLTGGTVTVGAITALGSAGAAGGFAGGTGGTVNVTKTGAAATAVTLNGLIDVRGGNATAPATGGTGGAVTINAGAGTVSSTANIATLINATGGTGQNGGTVAINATGNIGFTGAGNKAIVTSGGTATANTAGRNAGNITLASSAGNVTALLLTANGSAGNGGNNVGGSGGTISVSGVGATLNAAVSAVGGNSVGTGAGGTAGTVTVTGTTGTVSSIAAGTINVTGGRGQDGGTVTVSSGGTGTVNLAGTLTASGGAAETGSAGQNAGTVNVGGGTVTVGAVTAVGTAAAAGSNQAGGLGGNVTVTKLAGPGAVTLTGAVTTQGGNSDGTGNGGSSGAVTVNGAGGNVTVGGTITTTGGRGQDAGAVSIASTGAIAVNNTITASGGTAATNASGRSGGAVTITGGSVATRAITASGSNAASANQGGGNAGTINLTSTAGGITVNAGGTLTARAGAATGTGVGGAAGGIALNATGGNIAANAITTQGNAKTDGGVVTLAATGTVTAGAITTTGGTGINSAGRSGGAVSATGADVTVGAITTSGGAGAGTNQAGGNAGSIVLDATDGSPTIMLNGNLAAAGGARTGTGTPGNGASITLDGNVELTANRTITAAGAAGGGAGGTATFGGTINSQGAARNLTVNTGTGTVAFGGALGNTAPLAALNVTATGIALPAVNAASMTLASNNGNITQSGAAVITGATAITAGTGTVTLANAGNNFNSVTVASSASTSIVDSNALTVGPVTATGDVLIQTGLAAGSDITLAGNISSTTGNVTLASGDDINYGAFAPSAPLGRWLTYSFSPATNTGTLPVPGGAKPNIYNCTFGGACGATIPAGNHNVYRYQPLLTYTANAANRQYGDPNPAFSGAVSGLVNGDTAADAYSGTLAFTSPAVGTTPVGGAAINGSGLTSDIGYGFTQAPGNATALTITARPITLIAGSAARVYGDPNPVPAPLYTVGGNGMANAEDAQALFGFTVASGAIGTTPVGAYAVGANAYNIAGVGVGANGNYTVTAINPGTLTINTAPLTVTANDAARTAGQPNPPFSATYAGFKNGETPAALGGALAVATPATITSMPGPYAITPSGQTATNYAITFVDGVLTVTPVPVVPVVPVPPVVSGVAAADNALITATQRSADAEGEVAPRLPDANGVDCLELERAGQRRVLTRCF